MAGEITRPTLAGPGLMPVVRGAPLCFNNDEGDGDTAVICVDAPGAGKAIYITHVTMSGRTTDVAITLQDEGGTVLFGPIQMQDSGGSNFTKDWKHPLKLIDDKALYVFATADQSFTLYCEYFIGQAPIT